MALTSIAAVPDQPTATGGGSRLRRLRTFFWPAVVAVVLGLGYAYFASGRAGCATRRGS